MFDNEAGVPYPPVRPRSRALWLRINYRTHTVSLLRQILAPNGQPETGSQGSVQTLPNGNVFVGWGNAGTFAEYDHRGRPLLQGTLPEAGTTKLLGQTFPNNWQSYRSFKERWSAMPTTPPVIATWGRGGLEAAWNGATEVVRWRLLAGAGPEDLRPIRSRRWDGLITSLGTIGHGAAFVEAVALDADGRTLGQSRVLRIR
jgi:hypothetical protein